MHIFLPICDTVEKFSFLISRWSNIIYISHYTDILYNIIKTFCHHHQ